MRISPESCGLYKDGLPFIPVATEMEFIIADALIKDKQRLELKI